MSKRVLDQEANMMYHLLWEKKEGKAIRNILNKEFHVFRMSYKETYNNFMKIRSKGGGPQEATNPNPKKWGARIFKDKEKNLGDLVSELISVMAAKLKTDADKPNSNVKLIEENKVHIKFSIEGPPAPYNYIQNIKTVSSKIVFKQSKYDWVLEASGKSASGLAQIGHVTGVAVLKGRLAESFFEGASTAEPDPNNPIEAGPLDTEYLNNLRDEGLKAYQKKMKELLPNLSIEHYRDVNVKNGVLENVIKVETDLDSAFHNEIIMANSTLEAPHTEKEISALIKEAFKAGQKAIHDKYKKDGVEGEVNKARSQPFITAMKGAILTPKVRKLVQKRGKVLKIKKPKSIPPHKSEAKKKNRKYAVKLTKLDHTKDIAATGGLPKAQISKRTTEKPNSVAPLYALLNAKLPQTVAKNMGAPGLESRSGRFASSVRVTDVNQTAKGFPSVGYTYQKNPYQVFEGGVGHSSWATPARDPRKLIDASIREIAQQLAVGRFYTRRV